jgi:glycosyltransferase involved in cell wall biosynthesis
MENNKPIISVLLPVYNVEKYIGHCLETIINQTYKNIEIIVVDDCSPDNSGKIAEDYAKMDSRIKVIHHEYNKGLSATRNTGIENSSGEYITFIDSDDWVSNDYVEYLFKIIIETNSDVAMVRSFFTSRFKEQVEHDRIYTITPEDMLCDLLYNRIHEGVWNRLYKRSVIGEKRFRLESKTGEGMQFNTQVLPNAKLIGVGLKRIYTYNVDNATSATKKPNLENQSYGAVETMDYIRNNLLPRSKRLDDAVEYQYFTTSLYALTHIVRCKAIQENKDFYNYLIKTCRNISKKSFKMELSFKQKLKSLCTLISPLLTVKLAIIWRYKLARKQRV